jgi:ABC-type multidrug transport system ATPase subunit
MRRGVSGGERKRISIGYELITNPALMLLDEPTSGLDSSTALRIVKLLKKLSTRGMGVLATIHQPSSELFMLFDRVILLSEGFTIYSGPPDKVAAFFSNWGFNMPKFSNPADKLSKIASAPWSELKGNVTIIEIAETVRV